MLSSCCFLMKTRVSGSRMKTMMATITLMDASVMNSDRNERVAIKPPMAGPSAAEMLTITLQIAKP